MIYGCSQPRELWFIDFNHVCKSRRLTRHIGKVVATRVMSLSLVSATHPGCAKPNLDQKHTVIDNTKACAVCYCMAPNVRDIYTIWSPLAYVILRRNIS